MLQINQIEIPLLEIETIFDSRDFAAETVEKNGMAANLTTDTLCDPNLNNTDLTTDTLSDPSFKNADLRADTLIC